MAGLGGLLTKLGGGAAGANPAGLGIAAGAGLLKAGLGFLQQAKGKKMLKKAKDPGYVIPEGFSKNLGQAEQMARTGLPSQEYNLASTNIQRGTQAGLRQLGRMSNPFAAIQGLARNQSDAFSRLDASNSAARRQNILQAMSSRREMAQQQLAQQQYAQNRYFDEANEANARIGAGTQNIFGGLSDIGSAGIMSGMGAQGENLSGGGGSVIGASRGSGFLSKLFRGKRLREPKSGLGFKGSQSFNYEDYASNLGL
jgi:hypothetical protein